MFNTVKLNSDHHIIVSALSKNLGISKTEVTTFLLEMGMSAVIHSRLNKQDEFNMRLAQHIQNNELCKKLAIDLELAHKNGEKILADEMEAHEKQKSITP